MNTHDAREAPVPVGILLGSFGAGGLERAVLTYLQEIDRTRFAPQVICQSMEGVLRPAFEALQLPIHCIRLRRWNLPWVVRKVCALVRNEGLRLLHSHAYHADIVARLAAWRTGVPCLNTLHTNSSWKREPHGLVQHFRRWFDGVTARLAHPACIALTASIEEFHRNVLKYPDGLWQVLPNPLSVTRLQVGEDVRARVRTELGLTGSDVFVLAVGNLLPVKGHRVLVEALQTLPDDLAKTVFLGIAGEGPERANLEAAMAQPSAARMRLLGYREDIGELLAAADLYAMPSFSEGQSVAILEAMYAKKAMLLTTQGGHVDFLEDKVHARLVPPGESTLLAQALADLVKSPGLRAQLAESACARLDQLGITDSIPRQMALYHTLLHQ